MEFTASTKDLKKTLFLVSLSVGEASETITGHTLFDVKDGQVFLYSTDNDRMSRSYLPTANLDTSKNVQFTADPKKIQKLVGTADSENIRFVYEEATKTLNVFASDNSDSYVSFASFAPEDFLNFEKDLESAKDLKTLNAHIFLSGIKFMQGFLPDKETNKKYSSIFVLNGAMYASNGSNKIGGFAAEDLKDISITIRQAMLPAIISLIDSCESTEMTLSETDKITILSSKDELHSFAFRKSTITPPKLPLSLEAPNIDHITLEKAPLLKKLNRLSIAYKDEFGIKMMASPTELVMETISDRKSYEKMPCKGAEKNIEFNIECNKIKFLIGFFESNFINLYLDATKCTFYCEDDLIIEEVGRESIRKSFKAVGIHTLARVI